MRNKNNNSGYSILISLMVIGFLIVVTSGVFKVVLLEMGDNRGTYNYLKSYNAAEGVGEFALLQIKEKGYAYDDVIVNDLNNRSIMLASDPEDISALNKNKDVLISFNYNYTVDNYEGELAVAGHDIIPLFSIDSSGEKKVLKLKLDILSGDSSNLTWNIMGKDKGISGIGIFDSYTIGKGRDVNSGYFERGIENFLTSSDTNYLILLNLDPTNTIKYKLISENPLESFTKPRTQITASAEIGGYKQNLDIGLDNTEFLNILKYSIYSN